MYPAYFGLKEASFSITPDPHYLFLSERHREALAHLLYGTGEGGGFVLLTGEVGAGKTTICRAFLEQLPEDVDVALILNPALSASELLLNICREFGVATPPEKPSVKTLVDALNVFLLATHAQGRRPVLIIDEAQNLRFKVLEQIRLLTNLETPKHKLLQIFLIGQPELRDMLNEPRFRPLAQRITARYHLDPLDARETADYIQHRLKVAGAEHALFSKPAIKAIYCLSGGVPRLINILCERCLLGAYATHSRQVDPRIVLNAAREVLGHAPKHCGRSRAGQLARAALLVIASLTAGWGGVYWLEHRNPDMFAPAQPASLTQPNSDPTPSQNAAHEAIVPAATTIKPAASSLVAPSAEGRDAPPMIGVSDKGSALSLLRQLWGIDETTPSDQDPCEQVRSYGLACRQGRATEAELRRMDRPALLSLQDPMGGARYAVLTAIGPSHVSLHDGHARHNLSLQQWRELWTGEYLLFWRTAEGGRSLIGPRSPDKALRWLGKSLQATGDLDSQTEPPADYAALRPAIIEFQRREGLEADGIAGPETLMRLNNALNRPGIVHLRHED
jgi:general secretion pathway protein A